MENPIKMGDLVGKPTIFGNTQMIDSKIPRFGFNGSTSRGGNGMGYLLILPLST